MGNTHETGKRLTFVGFFYVRFPAASLPLAKALAHGADRVLPGQFFLQNF